MYILILRVWYTCALILQLKTPAVAVGSRQVQRQVTPRHRQAHSRQKHKKEAKSQACDVGTLLVLSDLKLDLDLE